MDHRKIIVFLGLAAALVAVVVVSWIWFTPTSTFPLDTSVPIAPITEEEAATLPEPSAPTSAAASGGAFDLDVLGRTGYKSLDLRPIQDGLLPIKPPATTGKANPFL